MKNYCDLPDRQSHRLKGYDYSQDGKYFVTICTKYGSHFFGEVRNAIMGLSDIGNIAAKFWQEIPLHFPFIRLDEWIVMPNHLHGVLHFVGTRNFASVQLDNKGAENFASVQLDNKGAENFASVQLPQSDNSEAYFASLRREFGPLQRNSLSSVIQSFKATVKRWCNKNDYENFFWHVKFYDHIIRNEESLNRIRAYTRNNPSKWQDDVENKINNLSEWQIRNNYDLLFNQ